MNQAPKIRNRGGGIRKITVSLIAMLTGALAPTHAANGGAEPDRSKLIRAAMVFNIARFVEWERRDVGSPLVLCVSPEAELFELIHAYDGRDVGQRELEVQTLDDAALEVCHIAYLVGNDATAQSSLKMSAAGVVTISRKGDLSADVGMIELIQVGKQTRFEINNTLAKQSGVVVSSKLLRLAVKVR